jgi:hypothetical protein
MIINFPVSKKGSKSFHSEIHSWDLTEQLSLQEILQNEHFKDFKKIARIKERNDRACGYEIEVLDENFKNRGYVLYLIVIHGKVLKGGKCKGTIDTRSYPAGTEKSWVNNGTPSEPNYIYSQIFRTCLKLGVEVDFYGVFAPVQESTYKFFGQKITQLVSSYEECEVIMNSTLKSLKGGNLIGEGDLLQKYKK